VVAGLHTVRGEVVRQAGGPFVELTVGESAIFGDDGLTVGGDVGYRFEQVCEVPLVGHGRTH